MGLGRRTFAPGEVLTASNVMNYLQDQAVMNFAGTAARGSGIPTPWQGATIFRQDIGAYETYYAAAGTANPGGRSVAGWYQEPKGRILNAYYAEMSAVQTFSAVADSFQDLTGLSITLTPQSATSKFIVSSTVFGVNSLASSRSGNEARILRGATTIQRGNQFYTSGDNGFTLYTYVLSKLDEPATASSITYKTQFAQQASGSTLNVFINRIENSVGFVTRSFLQVLEISS
jgi:hypothetical protein